MANLAFAIPSETASITGPTSHRQPTLVGSSGLELRAIPSVRSMLEIATKLYKP